MKIANLLQQISQWVSQVPRYRGVWLDAGRVKSLFNSVYACLYSTVADYIIVTIIIFDKSCGKPITLRY